MSKNNSNNQNNCIDACASNLGTLFYLLAGKLTLGRKAQEKPMPSIFYNVVSSIFDFEMLFSYVLRKEEKYRQKRWRRST